MDSNHRRRKPADLQSAPVGHLGNLPTSNLQGTYKCKNPTCFSLYPGFVSCIITSVYANPAETYREREFLKKAIPVSLRTGIGVHFRKSQTCCNTFAAERILQGSKLRARLFVRASKPTRGQRRSDHRLSLLLERVLKIVFYP